MTDIVFYSLWKPLYLSATRRGIDRDDAKDVIHIFLPNVIGKGRLPIFSMPAACKE
jgi:hypothetical protein